MTLAEFWLYVQATLLHDHDLLSQVRQDLGVLQSLVVAIGGKKIEPKSAAQLHPFREDDHTSGYRITPESIELLKGTL